MGYFDFPHTRTYDSDLGFLIKQYKKLNERMDSIEEQQEILNQIYAKVKNDIHDITLEQLQEYLDNGTIESILEGLTYSKLNNVNEIAFQRVFRYINYVSDTLVTQSCCNTGTSFLLGGNTDNTAQRIVETSLDGTLIRQVNINSTILGHFNDMVYKDDYIYAVNGTTGAYIIKINYSDLTINSSNSLDLANAYGISIDDKGNIFVLGYNDSYTTLHLYLLDEDTLTINEYNTMYEPYFYGKRATRQGMVIWNNKVLLLYSEPNCAYQYNLETGEYETTLTFGYGDGMNPIGELESATVIDNQLFLYSNASIGSGFRNIYVCQIFATNLGKEQSYIDYLRYISYNLTLHVDNSTNYNNPIGTTDTPFYHVEEACICYQYQSLHSKNVVEIDIDSTLSDEYCIQLVNCDAIIRLNATICKWLTVQNTRVIVYNGTIQGANIQNTRLTLNNATINNDYNTITATGSDINLINSSSIYDVTANQSTINYIRGANGVIGTSTLTTTEITSTGTLALNLSMTSSNTYTYTITSRPILDNLINYQLGDLTLLYNFSNSYGEFSCTTRLTTSNRQSLYNGSSVTRYMQLLFSTEYNSWVQQITITYTPTSITMLLGEAINLSTRESGTTSLTCNYLKFIN